MNPVDGDFGKAQAATGIDEGTTSRRRLLKQAGLAAGVVWVAPIVTTLNTPAAAASGTSTVGLWKGNAQIRPLATICDGSVGSGTANNRGTIVFRRKENPTPTMFVDISIANGPALTGTCNPTVPNARDVYILQADINGNCLSQTLAGCFNGANGTFFTFSAPITAGAVNFAVALLQSGGGGTDTYWTNPLVNLP